MAKEKILVVEDEAIIATDIQNRVKRLGYSVSAIASSGEEAIEKAEETHPDLVLMDIRLKGMIDGIEAAGQIRERFDIPVLYLTAYADDATLQRAKITGPYGYVLKPVRDRELHSNIAIALHKHEMERELKEYTKELERANRDLKNYAYTISHDLREPLDSIQAFSSFMRDYADKLDLDEKGKNYLDMLQKAAARMIELMEDLLLLSRFGRQYTEAGTVDLNALVEEIKTELSTRIEERSGEVVAGNLPTISTIKVWMKELLMNLIDNGLKFNESAKPRVEVGCEEREKENDYLFMVKDNGIGIEEENQDRIFNLIDTPQSEYGCGTGVGLAICKRIVTEFGGTIRVESKPAEGSTFFFTVPKPYQHFDSA